MSDERDDESARERIVRELRGALEFETRVNLHRYPLHIDYLGDQTVLLEGEVESVAAKRIALERAGAIPGPRGVVDRLKVAPARRMGDGEIRDAVRDGLAGELALSECAIAVRDAGALKTVREAPKESPCTIQIAVEDGTVTLDGRVGSLAQKRLAGVLAWWVPGTRDVVNGIEVSPAQEDNDFEIVDAVRAALEKDRMVDAGEIRVGARRGIVMLEGLAIDQRQKEMAENDAWYVFGVNDVVNRIEMRT